MFHTYLNDVSYLLERCFLSISMAYFQGVEFLSYILTLDTDLMMMVNNAIKFMIPELKDVQLSRVGEVYYEGIEHAKSRDCLPLYEKECIQGLIVCALHCHRFGVNKAAQSVAKV